MRDEERIAMYYKFGLTDWRNEQNLPKEKSPGSSNSISTDATMLVSAIMDQLRILGIKFRGKVR